MCSLGIVITVGSPFLGPLIRICSCAGVMPSVAASPTIPPAVGDGAGEAGLTGAGTAAGTDQDGLAASSADSGAAPQAQPMGHTLVQGNAASHFPNLSSPCKFGNAGRFSRNAGWRQVQPSLKRANFNRLDGGLPTPGAGSRALASRERT